MIGNGINLMRAVSRFSRDRDSMTWVEQRAVEAMCAVLCCGPIFEPIKAIGDDGYLYPWLEALLTSQHGIVHLRLFPFAFLHLNTRFRSAL